MSEVSRLVSSTGTSFLLSDALCKGSLYQCHARQQFDASLTRRQQNSLDASNTLDDEVLASDSASLVEAADVDATSERNTERLGTEDRCRAGRVYA